MLQDEWAPTLLLHFLALQDLFVIESDDKTFMILNCHKCHQHLFLKLRFHSFYCGATKRKKGCCSGLQTETVHEIVFMLTD